jgi:mannose-6-phosphate isomerase-like protein (cupin superfamily)
VKRKTLRFGKGFRVALANRSTQAAEMVIEPGGAEGGPTNRHRGADQWLFVVNGTGQARIQGRAYPLRAGVLVLIEHGRPAREPKYRAHPAQDTELLQSACLPSQRRRTAPRPAAMKFAGFR